MEQSLNHELINFVLTEILELTITFVCPVKLSKSLKSYCIALKGEPTYPNPNLPYALSLHLNCLYGTGRS